MALDAKQWARLSQKDKGALAEAGYAIPATEPVVADAPRLKAISVEQPKREGKRRGEMNALESDFGAWLEYQKLKGELIDVQYESHKYRLGEGAWYCPDFYCVAANGKRLVYETKGFMREAANVRIKTAASLYPDDEFYVVKRTNRRGEWKIARVKGKPVRA